MNVILDVDDGIAVDDELKQSIIDAAAKVMQMYDVPNVEVSITLTDVDFIHRLNKKYRGIDRPTDVLSFALDESVEPDIEGGPDVDAIGDIIISMERAREQAGEYGHSIKRETVFLTVHGMLHLLGYDHMEEQDRLEMEAEQRHVMNELGIPRE